MKTDPDLWAQWTEIMTEDGKKVRCNYCGNKQRRHAAKCRRHTLVCKQAPKEVKMLVGQRFADAQEYIDEENEGGTLDQTGVEDKPMRKSPKKKSNRKRPIDIDYPFIEQAMNEAGIPTSADAPTFREVKNALYVCRRFFASNPLLVEPEIAYSLNLLENEVLKVEMNARKASKRQRLRDMIHHHGHTATATPAQDQQMTQYMAIDEASYQVTMTATQGEGDGTEAQAQQIA